MKTTIRLAATLALLLSWTTVEAQGVYHRGYSNPSGTYVAPHYQSAPDHSYNNNWGVAPNVNPYSGQMGTRQPTFNDRPPSAFGR